MFVLCPVWMDDNGYRADTSCNNGLSSRLYVGVTMDEYPPIYHGVTRFSPNILREIIIKGLKERGMLTKNANVNHISISRLNFWGQEKTVEPHKVHVDFTRPMRDID